MRRWRLFGKAMRLIELESKPSIQALDLYDLLEDGSPGEKVGAPRRVCSPMCSAEKA
jgi:hypothetical protein